MKANEVLDLIHEIRDTPGRTEKEALVAKFMASTLGRFVLNWAYNPFVTYGLTPTAPVKGTGGVEFTVTIEKLLRALATRQLTGHAAIEKVQIISNALDDAGAELLYLILSKDLKAGIGISTINKVMPGLIPVFSVMRAHAYDVKKVKKWPWRGEPKLDGMRCDFVCRDGIGGFFSRSGSRWPALDDLVPKVMAVAKHAMAHGSNALRTTLSGQTFASDEKHLSFVLDSEVMTGLFATTGKIKGKSKVEGAEIHMFDIMSYADFDAVGTVGEVLSERRTLVEEFFEFAAKLQEPAIQMTPYVELHSDEEAQEQFDRYMNMTLASYLARGDDLRETELLALTIDKETGKPKTLEGMILKNPDALYEKKKSYQWMKFKGEETEDLPIVGFFNGKAGSEFEHCMGGVIVDRNGVEVRIGGGWSKLEREKEIIDLWVHDATILGLDPKVGFKGSTISLAQIQQDSAQCNYKLLGRLIEVKFHEVTPDGSLRHPNFVRFRDDKAGEVESKEAA